MHDPIFNPIRINQLEVKNRIYLPAMHLGMANNFEVTDQLVDFYAERAKGGAGLICVGFATVDERSGNMQNIGAHDDSFVPGLQKLAAAIRDNGAAGAVQLNHAGRYNHSFFLNGKKPVAPSPIASRLTKEEPHELTQEEITTIVEAFAQAALRVKQAGFDALEILAGTGYLISSFLSPLTNQRQDEYGGSLENRMRFGLEVIQRVRAALGEDYPLLVRMNGNDFMPGGQGRLELQEWAQALEKASVDALCVNVGWHEARVPQIVSSVPRGVYAYLAKGIKDKIAIPVIASHRINDPHVARELLVDGMCDMVAMGRALIADPYLPHKAQQRREDEIIHCVGCAQGCFDHLFKLQHIECLCNPRAGHERTRRVEPTASPKKVMVIGAGAAGMSAALAARERDHQVSLYEKSDQLGGQLFLAAAPPGRGEFLDLARDLAKQIQLKQIPVTFHCEMTADLVEKESPDVVILATGAQPIDPPIPGHELPHVVQAWDVLRERVTCGRKVVIIGGGAVGVETALYLAEKGTLSGEALKFLLVNRAEDPETLFQLASQGSREVLLIEMIDKIGKDIGKSTRWGMLQDLSRVGVDSLTETKALAITPEGVQVEKDGQTQTIRADSVVLAAGATPCNPLQKELEKRGIACKVVGDAQAVALAFEAVHQGFQAGNSI